MRQRASIIFLFALFVFILFNVVNFITQNREIHERVIDHTKRKPRFLTLNDVHDTIWRQIHSLQEEGDCESKKILVCENKASYAGFGSMVMRYGACIQLAYALGRIYFIKQKEYAHFGGLSHWLKKDSEKCGYLLAKYENQSCNLHDLRCYLENGYDINNTFKVLEYTPNQRVPAPRPVPGSIPKYLKEVLLSLNVEKPWLWFTSQFVGYLMLRPNDKFRKTFDRFAKMLHYEHPITSIHIRRGDKIGKEFSLFIPASDFLKTSDDFYDEYYPQISIRRVFVASDDKNINEELKDSKKHRYKFSKLPDEYLKKALMPYKVDGFPEDVLESMFLDLYFLTKADYTICTYTSNVCRLIHSLKLSSYPYTVDSLISIERPKLTFYMWFGWSAPFWNYYISIRSNTYNRTLLDGFPLIPYTVGTLFSTLSKKVILTDKKSSASVLYCMTMYKFKDTLRGYVYTDDIVLWPGEPKYHFFEN